jgi:hypothetical protein
MNRAVAAPSQQIPAIQNHTAAALLTPNAIELEPTQVAAVPSNTLRRRVIS